MPVVFENNILICVSKGIFASLIFKLLGGSWIALAKNLARTFYEFKEIDTSNGNFFHGTDCWKFSLGWFFRKRKHTRDAHEKMNCFIIKS
jgi:hypothetical protein